MSIKKNEIARCGSCRFYTPIGRRGGDCSQFGVPVQSAWKSCCLAKSPFQKLTKISASEIKLAKLTMENKVIAVEKTVVVEGLSVPLGRFQSQSANLLTK